MYTFLLGLSPSLDMLGGWTRPTTYVKMSCSRSNDSKLFHFKYKGRVVGMHLPLLFIEGGWYGPTWVR